MPSNGLLLVIVVSGHLFLQIFKRTRLSALTWDGPRLILGTAAAGGGLFALSRVLALVLELIPWAGRFMHSFVHAVFPVAYAGSLVLTVLLAVFLPLLLNMRLPKDWVYELSKTMPSTLERLMAQCTVDRQEMMFTMSDDKVYIGFVTDNTFVDPRAEYFRLLPIASGYRDKDDRDVSITTDYISLFLEEESIDFTVVLPLSDVVSGRVFDPDLFQNFFNQTLRSPALEDEVAAS